MAVTRSVTRASEVVDGDRHHVGVHASRRGADFMSRQGCRRDALVDAGGGESTSRPYLIGPSMPADLAGEAGVQAVEVGGGEEAVDRGVVGDVVDEGLADLGARRSGP
jgi:hypothetical protein